jgi:hypothetical protein
MYPPTFTTSCGPKSPLEWAWSPLDSNDSSLHITTIPIYVTCLNLPLNHNAPLSFGVFAIPFNVIILRLDDSFVDLILQNYQVHDVVSFNVYHLYMSKFDVTNDPPNRKQKCSEGKSWKKSDDNTKKFQIEWAAKVPWAEGAVSTDCTINLMKCKVCSLIVS